MRDLGRPSTTSADRGLFDDLEFSIRCGRSGAGSGRGGVQLLEGVCDAEIPWKVWMMLLL